MTTEKRLKPKFKFYSCAEGLIKRNCTENDIIEASKEFDITEKQVKDWLQNYSKSKALGQALFASKPEKEGLYNLLDTKFVETFPNIVLFRRGENDIFYEYQNGFYRELFDHDIYNMVDTLMSQYSLLEYRSSTRRVKDTVQRISSLLARTPGKNFNDDLYINRKWYLNLRNGLLDIENEKIIPHTPSYFSTVQVNYEYDKNATCPQFLEFIDKVSCHNPDNALMIQMMFGYCLIEGNPQHKVFYLFGDTARNGKSTTAKILCGLIGWGNVSTLSLQQLASENSSILTSIIGKQINFSDEISSKYIESSRLTAMSAEGIIEINPKYKSSFLYQVRSKFVITCNDLPNFSDFQGMKHRMVTIPFRYHLKEEERVMRFDEVLLEREGAGILNWAIEGIKKLIENKWMFKISEESMEDLHQAVIDSNPVYHYLENNYEFSPKFTTPYTAFELYGEAETRESPPTNFRLFCEQIGRKTKSFDYFSKELKRYSDETHNIERIRVGKKGERAYRGLKEKKEIADDELLNSFTENI